MVKIPVTFGGQEPPWDFGRSELLLHNILLMVQKSHSQPPGMGLKHVVNNGRNYQPQQVRDFFHQQYQFTNRQLYQGVVFFRFTRQEAEMRAESL